MDKKNEKLFTIAKFHETRLGRIEKYLGTVEKKMEEEFNNDYIID